MMIMPREEARLTFVQNIIFSQVLEEFGKIYLKAAKDKCSLILGPIGRSHDAPSIMRFNGEFGVTIFKFCQGRIEVIGPNRTTPYIYEIPSFEDPKFDPQKIIDLILLTIEEMYDISLKHNKLKKDCKEAFSHIDSNFKTVLEIRT